MARRSGPHPTPTQVVQSPATTATQTPDPRAAISYVLLCTTDEDAPTVGGAGSDECVEAEPFVRWEWDETQNQFVAEDGASGTTMTATAYEDQDEPVEATWTSDTYNLSGAVVGAGGATCGYPGDSGPLPHASDVEACSGNAGGGPLPDLGDVGPGIGGALLVGGGLVAVGSSIATRVFDR